MKNKNKKIRNFTKFLLVTAGLLVVSLLNIQHVHADVLEPATCTYDEITMERTCDLYAKTGTITLVNIPFLVPPSSGHFLNIHRCNLIRRQPSKSIMRADSIVFC